MASGTLVLSLGSRRVLCPLDSSSRVPSRLLLPSLLLSCLLLSPLVSLCALSSCSLVLGPRASSDFVALSPLFRLFLTACGIGWRDFDTVSHLAWSSLALSLLVLVPLVSSCSRVVSPLFSSCLSCLIGVSCFVASAQVGRLPPYARGPASCQPASVLPKTPSLDNGTLVDE